MKRLIRFLSISGLFVVISLLGTLLILLTNHGLGQPAFAESPAPPSGKDKQPAKTPNPPDESGTISKKRIEGALDKLEKGLKTHSQYQLRIVWIIDNSPSLGDDLKLLSNRIERIFKLYKNQKRNLKMAVIGFGDNPELHCKMTANVKLVKKAINKVGFEGSGTENCIRAIRFAINEFGRVRGKKIFILVTDEAGDDTRNFTQVESVLEELVSKRHQITMFVIGYEANLNRVTGYEHDERVKHRLAVNRGLVSIVPEVYADCFAGLRPISISGGFGCYTLARLARETGGDYYLLNQPSFDPEIMKQYQPDLYSQAEYDKSNQKDELKRIVSEITAYGNKTYVRRVGAQRSDTGPMISEAKRYLKKLGKSVKRLTPVLRKYRLKLKAKKDVNKRWLANGELVLAHLMSRQYYLEQYILVLEEWKKRGTPPMIETAEAGTIFNVTLSKDYRKGPYSELKREEAKKALEEVIKHHPDTPWSKYAEDTKKMLKDYPGCRIYIYKPRRGTPQPRR